MNLGQLIKNLENLPQGGVIPFGFGKPMSYRGSYDQLAFEPVENALVSEMLEHARSAKGATFVGYKGGNYKMGDYSYCYIDNYGDCSGNEIGFTLIDMWRLHLSEINNTGLHHE